jgi:Flp pilus assembly protein TadG
MSNFGIVSSPFVFQGVQAWRRACPSLAISADRPPKGSKMSRSGIPRILARFHRSGLIDDYGQDLVEFGFALPLLVLLLLGIIESGLIYQSFDTITNAAREGARYGTITPANEGPSTCATPGGAIGAQAVCRLTAGLDPAQVTYRATSSGQTVALQVTYRYIFASGLVSQAFGGSPTLMLTANSTMRAE